MHVKTLQSYHSASAEQKPATNPQVLFLCKQHHSERTAVEMDQPFNIAQTRLHQPASSLLPPDGGPQSIPSVQLSQPKDVFTPVKYIQELILKPNQGKGNYSFPAVLTENGQIVQNTLFGPQAVGQIDITGEYRLINGQRGNLFQDSLLASKPGENTHPFWQQLQATERQRAITGSTIPLIRTCLNQKDIDGRGIKVGIIDSYEKNEPGPTQGNASPAANEAPSWKISHHSKIVASTINDPIWGVAPGAQVVDIGYADKDTKPPEIDNIQLFTNWMAQLESQLLIQQAEQLKRVIQLNDPALRVISMTKGAPKISRYNFLHAQVNMLNENNRFKYPKLRQAVLGNAIYGNTGDQIQAITRFADNLLENHPTLQLARQHYIEATRQATLHGIIPVCAMGNAEDAWPYSTPMPPGVGMDPYTQSPYVIRVAASSTNQTPDNPTDDQIATFSSLADSTQWDPTIAAPGIEIGIRQPYGPIGQNLVVQGTSFSTPYVCGVIAMMLQRNPNLTFDQVKAKLQQTATFLPNYPIAAQGAGVINPVQAVLN